MWLLDGSMDEPRLAYPGVSPTFSTNCGLMPVLKFIWDVNGYYRDLGVDPTATRTEIRDAYLANGGPSSDRLTYVAKQLLNPEIRARYDQCALGELFFDRYLQEVVDRRMKQAKADAVAAGMADPDDDGDDPFDLTQALNNAVALLDSARKRDKDGRPQVSPWGYFLWGTSLTDHSKLARWREMLVAAGWERGVITNLGVGHHSTGLDPWVVQPVGEALVVFIHRDAEPTEAMAYAAVSSINPRG